MKPAIWEKANPAASQPEIEIVTDNGSVTLYINGQEMGHFGGYSVKADDDEIVQVTVTLMPSKLTIGMTPAHTDDEPYRA